MIKLESNIAIKLFNWKWYRHTEYGDLITNNQSNSTTWMNITSDEVNWDDAMCNVPNYTTNALYKVKEWLIENHCDWSVEYKPSVQSFYSTYKHNYLATIKKFNPIMHIVKKGTTEGEALCLAVLDLIYTINTKASHCS